MKKYALMLAGMAFLAAKPMFADDMKMDKMNMDTKMCAKHCNIMDLEKKVDALKGQAASADKTATKEHLMKDIEAYEKKLKDLETELGDMK
jgi:hypothetical protein